MGSNVAQHSFQRAKEQGASDAEAFAFGVTAGIVEAVFENCGIEKIKALARTDAPGLKGFLLNVVKSAGVEGAEEGLTEIVDNLAESLILGDNSTLNRAYDEAYQAAKARGLSDAEAYREGISAKTESFIGDVGGAVAGGAAMGATFSAGGQALNRAYQGWMGPAGDLAAGARPGEAEAAPWKEMGSYDKAAENNLWGMDYAGKANQAAAPLTSLDERGYEGPLTNLAEQGYRRSAGNVPGLQEQGQGAGPRPRP